MSLEKYIDSLIENGLERDHWFMTKQTMTDYFFPFYIAKIVDTYETKHKVGQTFQQYYTACFKENPETRELYPKQCESENTFRNAIIAEFVGLMDRPDSQYAKAKSTEAYKRLAYYINCFDDIEKNKTIVDHQIEKICLNVVTNARKYEEVKNVTIFPVLFLYKILLGLYETYKDSTLTHQEFSLFVMRAKEYEEYENVLDYIYQYRKHNYSNAYDAKIKSIMEHQSTKNVRFDTLIGTLQHIEYQSDSYYRINNDQNSYDYISNIVSLYENSPYMGIKDKAKLKKFMQSAEFFKGTIDDVPLSSTVSEEEFMQMIETGESFISKLDELAKKYGIEGTTNINSEVRLPAVQKAFRDKLIEQHGCKCALCNVTNEELLIASHIKDAAQSDIYEKADFNNGLLLCANHDKLFDRFLITFNFYDGRIQISKVLTESERKIFMLDDTVQLDESLLNGKRMDYLMWHNEEFSKREQNR